MSLIYNATFDKNTRKLSFEDRAGNEIYSFTVPERGPAVDDIKKPLTFRATQDGSTVKLTKNGSPTGDFQTSRDGGNTWADYTIGTDIPLNTGEEVSFRVKYDRTSAQTRKNYFYFGMTGEIEAWHNVMSMYRTNDFATYESVVNYEFYHLFDGCTSLTKAPRLPATTLAQDCYSYMFMGCTSLAEAPYLPTTNLAHSCYYSMFRGCTSLTKAPDLPATTLANDCYGYMFYGCTSLTKAPDLSATTLVYDCYYGMFGGCTSLTKAPVLPATTLATYCYSNMFNGCTSLTEAPELPATALAVECYNSMFKGCTSLVKAPELPATTLANNCYTSMFKGCSSLNEVRCKMPPTIIEEDIPKYTGDGSNSSRVPWLSGVAQTGTFYTNADANWSSGASGIPEGWTRVNGEAPTVDDITKPLTFKAIQDGSTVKLTKSGSPTGDFQTSNDGGNTWTDYILDTAITLNIDDEVSFRAKSDRVSNQNRDDYFYFEMTGKIEAWNNVMSLYRTNAFAAYKSVVEYGLRDLFGGCTSLTKAPVLPATTLATYCYYGMFSGCTSLAEAPKLPATTLANDCYEFMFSGCTSLTKAPELPATTLATSCYEYMFSGCTSLTKAPELPATTLNVNCYLHMFDGCTSLTEAPELPATTLADNCYWSMFSGCTSLKKTPVLPATTLAYSCYRNMFDGCISLVNAPALPATTLANDCYTSMFNGCTSLTKAPELPAGKLAQYCYQYLFKGCTSLTKSPALSATTLADSCYTGMFKGCSRLNEVHCKMPSSYSSSQISNYALNWLEGVASTGTFYTSADVNWSSGASGIPIGWTRFNDGTPAVDDITKPLTFKATQGGSTVALTKQGLPIGDFQTSRDGGNTWTDYTIGTAITLNTGDKVSFRAGYDREFEQSDSKYFQFNMTGKIEAWHNVMSLYRTNDFATYKSVMKFAFYQLFKDCTSLTKAPRLPATTLASDCYRNMFRGCTSLTKAPYLPATSLAETCYWGMFRDCTSLTEDPVLSATRLGVRCYNWMFFGCSSLNKVHCHIPSSYSTEYVSAHADGWLEDVASTGTFYTNADANWSSGSTSGIPEGWTRVND